MSARIKGWDVFEKIADPVLDSDTWPRWLGWTAFYTFPLSFLVHMLVATFVIAAAMAGGVLWAAFWTFPCYWVDTYKPKRILRL